MLDTCAAFFQLVADAALRFTYVSAKFPGASHDSYVLRQTGHRFWQPFEDGVLRGRILGDKAYPSRRWLMTPIR